MDYINIGLRSYTIILLFSSVSLIAGSNINCNGKAFHCVNSTHFKICVDLGHGVSTTVDEFLIPCPQNTVCKQYNLFECEYELTTTPPVTIQSEVTNEQFKTIDSSVREQLDITTLFPTKQQEGMEFSEKYFDNVNATSASFTESLLTDAVVDSMHTSNANDLQTSSKGYINKTLNISRSTDKELTSIIETGIDVTKTSPYNINTLVTDIGVSSKYNTETPVFLSTTQDRRTIDSFKSESLEPLNQNRSDLDANYTVIKRTNQVSTVSESQYSAVTLLPGNFNEKSLQENTPGISNINHLIKSDNTSQDNLDILMKYNSTQLNNSDNSTQYRNINDPMYSKNMSNDMNTLNSTPFNVNTNEIFPSGVSDMNKESKVNSVITLKSSRQHLAEITTASTITVPGTTNEFSSLVSLNTEVIETLFNDGLNSITDLEKISVPDGDFMTSTSSIPETSVAKINDMSSQITKSGLNYGVSSVTLTKPVLDEKNAILSNQSQTSDTKSLKLRSNSEILNLTNVFEGNFTELNSVNNSQYLTTTEPFFHDKSDIPISSTSKSELTAPINTSEVLPFRSKDATQVHNASQINNVNTMESELVSTKNLTNKLNSSSIPSSNFSLFATATTKTAATNDKTIVGDYSFTSVDMLPVLTKAEMSNGATSLKPLTDLISENKTWSESGIVIGATGLDNINITTKGESNNMTEELSHGVTSFKPISDLISKNETSPKLVIVTVSTDLDNNHTTITEKSHNITGEISNGVQSLKSSDFISNNETSPMSVLVTVATNFDNKNTTITEESYNIPEELSNGVTSLKSISDLISNNETRPKPVMLRVVTDLDNYNITTKEERNNKTAEITKGVTSLKSISDLISKNKTSSKSAMVTVATDLDKYNITTKEESNNITAELYNGVTSLKPISDLILNNETRPKPSTVTVTTDLDNNNMTTTEKSNYITGQISNGVPSLKLISDLISKNATSSNSVMVTVATDLDNNNTTITEESYNITAELYNGVTGIKPISDFILNNETQTKPSIVTVTTDLDNNNMTTTEKSHNITGEISNGVSSLKSISEFISNNETSPKSVLVTVATNLDNNNTTITEESYNIRGELSNGVKSLKSIPDLITKNETSSKPVIVTVATDLDNNNTTTTGESYNTTGEISKGVTSLKPISDLISKNETWPKLVIVTVATDLNNNNITITEESNNITAELSNGVMSLKPILDLISKNETLPQSVMMTVATDLDNIITITEESNNITAELSNGVTSLKPISDLISKNETSSKSAMVATDLDNNNITTTEESKIIQAELSNGVTSLKPISDLISKNETWPTPVIVTVATRLDNNNTTITEESYNTTDEITKEVTSLKSISDLTPTKSKTQPTVLKFLTANDTFHKENIFETTSTILTEDQSLNESTTSLSSLTKIPDNILNTKDLNKGSVRLISSTDSVISDLERNTTRIVTNLPTTLENPTTLFDSSSGVFDNNNTDNNDTTKPIIISLYEVNKALSSNYTYNDINNSTPDVYQTTIESDRALNTVETLTGPAVFESPNSMNVTNNTFIVIDVLAEHRVVSDKNKNIENTSKLESEITTKPSTYFDSNKSLHIISSDTKNMTTLSSQSTKYDINAKQVIYKNTNDKNKIVGQNTFGNLNSTKLNPENILTPKFVTSNNFSSSPAFHINNNITDKNNNSLKNVEVKHYQVTNNLVEKLLTVGVNNTYLNYTNKNVVPTVSNNSKSIPFIYLHNSLTKSPITNIYNVSHSENISQTHTVNETTASNKNHKTEDKESSQTNINEPAHAVSIIKHERNKTEYLLHNPYTQVNTTAIKVNDTTLKELPYNYNFSETSFTMRNNVNDFMMKNITISIDNNNVLNGFNDTKGSGYNKSNSTTTIKSVNTNSCKNCSKVADNFQLSDISNSQFSGIVIKPLLIEPLQDVKNTSSLHPENGNTFSGYTTNNRGVIDTTPVANYTKPTETPTLEGNVSEVNNLTFIRTTEKYTNELNATSESNNTANNLLKNTSSQTNTIKNKIHNGMSSNGLQFSRISSEFAKSSQSTGTLKMETDLFVSNRTKLEIISEQEKNTISDHTNRSNGMEKKKLTNGHGHSESNITIATGVTKNNRNNTQTSFTTPINNINYPNRHYGNLPTNQEFRCTKRGKFSDAKDCKKFFVCIGRVQPVIGLCPTDTVFSEYLKQCTKNVTHCIRNNLFKCTAAGRFINILCNNTYFICAKKNSSFIKFTFQCQKGYYLDKNSIKCTPELKNISKSDESSSKNTKELSFDKSKEMEGVSTNSKNVFECEEEGKFKDPQDCRKYYVCIKGRKSIYRRKIKQCDSDEVFHRKKKKCVDVESYECNL